MKLGANNMEKPAIITAEVEKQVCRDAKKVTAVNIKYVVLAIAAVCITVTVITGFAVFFKYHAETTANIITREVEGHPNEEIKENLADRTKLYTIGGADGMTQYILYDFNRQLKLIKDGSNRCMVTSMNQTETDVETMYHNHENGESKMLYKSDNEPVHDKSFLSQRGQELCEHEHVYWAMQSCGDDSVTTELEPREKRAVARSEEASCCPPPPGGECCVWCGPWKVCSPVYCVRVVLNCYDTACQCNFVIYNP